MNTMQEYLQAMMMSLRNPLVPPNLKAQLQAHIKITNANLIQMQMLAAQGMIFGGMQAAMGANGMGANAMGMGNVMANPMMMQGMGNGNPQLGMPQQQQQPQQQMMHHGRGGHRGGFNRGGGFGFRGRGGGGFRGRGGGGGGFKRQAEDHAGGMEKMQRVA